jgi:hypothetical protein
MLNMFTVPAEWPRQGDALHTGNREIASMSITDIAGALLGDMAYEALVSASEAGEITRLIIGWVIRRCHRSGSDGQLQRGAWDICTVDRCRSTTEWRLDGE